MKPTGRSKGRRVKTHRDSHYPEILLLSFKGFPRFSFQDFYTRCVSKMATPFSNQKDAVNAIIRNFKFTRGRYGLLRALVQVGKSGTYQYLIKMMLRLGMIDRAYIVCGSHETELRDQFIMDCFEWHGMPAYGTTVQVVLRQDFKKVTMNTERALIIVDESHLVHEVDQTLSIFMKRHGLTMAGTTAKMIRDHTYILSVDATPFAEESAIAYTKSRSKFVVELAPGANYYGPADYYRDGLIRDALDLTKNEGATEFADMLHSRPNTFAIVRVQSRSPQYSAILRIAEEAGCDVVHFTSFFDKATTQIVLTDEEARAHFYKYHTVVPSLESAPLRTTIVILDGRLRCGKRVPKKHISFVWEASKGANTDTIIQSLLGRMCGYLGDEDVYKVPLTQKPIIYVPARLLQKEESNKVLLHSDLERYFEPSESGSVKLLPRFASNLIPGRVQVRPERFSMTTRSFVPLYQCAPIVFHLTEEETSSLAGMRTGGRNDLRDTCLERFMANHRLVTENPDITEEQRDEILSNIGSSDISVRRYKVGSNANMYGTHMDAHLDRCASKEHVSDFPFLTFCIVFDEGAAPEGYTDAKYDVYKRPGTVFAIFYTEAEGKMEVIPKESRLSRVSDATHFTIHAGEEFIDCPAAGLYGFSPRVLEDARQFRDELDFFIKFHKESVSQGLGIVSKKLTALNSGDAIKLPCAVYGNRLEALDSIKAELESKWSTTITFEVARRRPVVDTLATATVTAPINRTLLSISWE